MSREANEAKLKNVLIDIFLMEDDQFQDENGPEQIEGWDSLATVSMAVAIHQQFGHHMTIEEVAEIHTIGDIKSYLRSKGVEI